MKKNIFSMLVVLLVSATSLMGQEKRTTVLITTEFGDIKLELYNETPLHRDNFIKLVNSGYYDSSIFHRVIKNFMIQGGGNSTGTSDVGYTIPAEINPKFIHKKGALAAARMGDQVNPARASSGSQFYIVQGQVFPLEVLGQMETRSGNQFTDEQKTAYSTVGGTPHLDNGYTVFGEVVSGLEVVDKIAAVQTAPGDKPLKDVKMKIKVLK